MKVSLNWIKEFVDIDVSPDEISEMLTMAGLEVEYIEHRSQNLNDFLVGRILNIEPHSDADRLSVCEVNAGRETLSIVCGASNIKKGDLVPVALPGTRLPDGQTIEEGIIRGVRSQGMLLAEDEMGLTDDHSGIMILKDGLKPGQSVSHAMDLEDWILEISLTPNRIDCASVLGIAREIGALTNKKIKLPEIKIKWGDVSIDDLAEVTVLDKQGCPRYTAGLAEQVRIAPSPFWMRYRLYCCGIRPISNVVDITNYVLLETGQPLHAFDYHQLEGRRIVVKRAENGQTFTTLDEQSREVDDKTLMICDGRRPVALAGIMGGLNSGITGSTTTVLIESAYFYPVMIRHSSRKMALSTEASYRFERGIDIEGTEMALKRALMLIGQLAGGNIARGIIDIYPEPWISPSISLHVDRTNEILGINVDATIISSSLSSLDMTVTVLDENNLEVHPPSFRVDITREADLIEEIARLVGYDNIPATIPYIRPSEEKSSETMLRDKVREILVGMGFNEIITYSFSSPTSSDILATDKNSDLYSFVRLLNPLSQDQSVMRTSLIPGLLSTLYLNLIRGQRDLHIFEWGKVYIKGREELPEERQILTALISGREFGQQWDQPLRDTDFFNIKGVAENIMEGIGIKGPEFKKDRIKEGLDPHEYAGIFFSGSEIGIIGKVSRKVMQAYEIETKAYIMELYIDNLLPIASWERNFKPLPKFPSVKRDISIIVDGSVDSAILVDIAKDIGRDLVESVDLFDIYQGKGIGEGEKALAIRISYRYDKGTLTDDEVNKVHEEVIKEMRGKTGGRLREG